MIPNDLILVHANPNAKEGSLVLASNDVSIIGRYHEEGSNMRFYVSPYASADDTKSISTDASSTQIWGIIIGLIRNYSLGNSLS
jgi:SOS-response transcriptional repressor LexA